MKSGKICVIVKCCQSIFNSYCLPKPKYVLETSISITIGNDLKATHFLTCFRSVLYNGREVALPHFIEMWKFGPKFKLTGLNRSLCFSIGTALFPSTNLWPFLFRKCCVSHFICFRKEGVRWQSSGN